jgi:hypothetical protein
MNFKVFVAAMAFMYLILKCTPMSNRKKIFIFISLVFVMARTYLVADARA